MSSRCSLSCRVNVSSLPRNARICGPRPVRILLTSFCRTSRFGSPPPRSDHRQAGQRLLGARIGGRVLQRDGVAVLQELRRRVGRRGQLDVLRTEQAGLPDLGGGVFRQLDVLVQAQREGGHPVLELDLADRADEDIGHHDPAVAVDGQGVRHLHVDGVGAGPDARTAGQRDVRDAVPAARAQHRRGHQQHQTLPGPVADLDHRSLHWPPPAGADAASAGNGAPGAAAGGGPDTGAGATGPGITSGPGGGGGIGAGLPGTPM